MRFLAGRGRRSVRSMKTVRRRIPGAGSASFTLLGYVGLGIEQDVDQARPRFWKTS